MLKFDDLATLGPSWRRLVLVWVALAMWAAQLPVQGEVRAEKPVGERSQEVSAEQISARGTYERFRRGTVNVTAPGALAGKAVELQDAGRPIATGHLGSQGDGATCVLTIPMPAVGSTYGALDLLVDGKPATTVNLPDARALRRRALYDVPLKMTTVFSGEKLPPADIEQPNLLEDLVGVYTITTRYFDAEYNEVQTAAKPGRYGAVVEITGEDGLPHRRYATLYRTLGKVPWLSADWRLETELGGEYGIDPAVMMENGEVLADQIRWRFRDSFHKTYSVNGLLESRGTAAVLAGLHEIAPGGGRAPQRLAPRALDDRWWTGLQKKLGHLEHRYLALLPEDYYQQAERRFPVLLYLHGSGERGLDVNILKNSGPGRYLRANPELPLILISPQCLPNDWWHPEEVIDLLEEVCAKYRVDVDRVYLTGLSMGAYGVWDTALTYPDRFAALGPISGDGDWADASRIKDVPTWVFHNAGDPIVRASASERFVDELRRLGAEVRFTVYPRGGHDSWTATYRNPELYQWLLTQRRGQPQPPTAH